MKSMLEILFPKKKPVEQVVAENNQKVHDIKNEWTGDVLKFEYELRKLHKEVKASTAYKVAVATGRV
jgi:hypothetical protein